MGAAATTGEDVSGTVGEDVTAVGEDETGWRVGDVVAEASGERSNRRARDKPR